MRIHGSQAFDQPPLVTALPLSDDLAAWAFDGATGAGVDVAIIDSGVQHDHPAVGVVNGAVAFEVTADGEVERADGDHEDLVGHGTACAGIIRALAPECHIYSVRVLGSNLKGKARAFATGLEWAIDNGMHVANLSLSTANTAWYADFHELADAAYFANVSVVGAINNVPRPSYPTEFASVISVAARAGSFADRTLAYNPQGPAEFGAAGIDVEVPWIGGGTATVSGNSFAAPHIAAIVTLMRSKHPWLTPFQVKAVLQALADNSAPHSSVRSTAQSMSASAPRTVR